MLRPVIGREDVAPASRARAGPATGGAREPCLTGERGLSNITPTQGDARRLPYQDSSFDAAFLTAVLSEIPDEDAALRELARVLKPGGRLVVGELFGDPHWVIPKRLRERAEAAALTFVRRSGTPLGYFAAFFQALEYTPRG